jgi:hypothetical protein
MKIKVYFLSAAIYCIAAFLLVFIFHSADVFYGGNESQQIKFISLTFYIIYSLKVFLFLLPVLFYNSNKNFSENQLIFVILFIPGALILIRVLVSHRHGPLNEHLKNLEIVLETLYLVICAGICLYVKGMDQNKKLP